VPIPAVCRIRRHRQRYRSRRYIRAHPDLARLPTRAGSVGRHRQQQQQQPGRCLRHSSTGSSRCSRRDCRRGWQCCCAGAVGAAAGLHYGALARASCWGAVLQHGRLAAAVWGAGGSAGEGSAACLLGSTNCDSYLVCSARSAVPARSEEDASLQLLAGVAAVVLDGRCVLQLAAALSCIPPSLLLLLLLLQVMWAVPSNKRTYLPRLGGPLCGITTSKADPARCGCYCLQLAIIVCTCLLWFHVVVGGAMLRHHPTSKAGPSRCKSVMAAVQAPMQACQSILSYCLVVAHLHLRINFITHLCKPVILCLACTQCCCLPTPAHPCLSPLSFESCHNPCNRFFVAQSDNTVRLVNTAAMAVEVSIHGLRPPPAAAALAAAGYGACCSAASSSPAGIVLQPGSGHLVLPAEHANLQFFDIARDRHVARLQVCLCC
jgi:hypothetical protein